MKKYVFLLACLVAFSPLSSNAAKKQKKTKKAKIELWPDGTPMFSWFSNAQKVDVDTLGKKYVITDYGVKSDSTLIQTQAIQAVIDRAANDGGGAIAIKGGKDTWADQAPENGPVYNVLIQNCHYGTVHGCLTLGSESITPRDKSNGLKTTGDADGLK